MSILSSARRLKTAFTLPELMVSMALFALVVAGVLSAHLYGLKMYESVKPKLGVSADSRRSLSRMTQEIQSATRVRVGEGSLTDFTEASTGAIQAGTAIQIEAAGGSWARYYFDAGSSTLRRTDNGLDAQLIVGHAVSNAAIFTAEDFTGNPVTNNIGNPVIGFRLQFSRLEHPVTRIATGELYQFYQFRTKITPRKTE